MNDAHGTTWHPKSAVELLLAAMIAVAAAMAIYGVLDGRQFQIQHTDTWEHTAVIRALTQDLANPSNPHLDSPEMSARYMPYLVGASLLGRALDLEPFQVLEVMGLTTIVLLLAGSFLFFRIYFQDRRAGYWGTFILLFSWGIPWTWGNVYDPHNLALAASWPANFVFALSLAYFAYVMSVLERPRPRAFDFVVICAIAWVCWLSHPLTGAITIAGAAALIAFRGPMSLAMRLPLGLAVLLALPLGELWPYFQPLEMFTSTTGSVDDAQLASVVPMEGVAPLIHTDRIIKVFYDPVLIAYAIWPLALALPAAILLLRFPRHWFISLGALGCLAVYGLNYFITVPLGHRFLLLSVFFLQCSMVALVVDHRHLVPAGSPMILAVLRLWRRLAIAVLVISATINMAVVGLVVFDGRLLTPTGTVYGLVEDMFDRYRRLAVYVPEDAVVLASESNSWPLPTFSGKVVVLHHLNPFVRNHLARRWDVEAFYKEATTAADREKILRAYGVTHILLEQDSLDSAVGDFVRARAREVYRDDLLVLYSL
jgi:hypothetical protein